MPRFSKALPISPGEITLFLQAGLMVIGMRLAIWLLPFRKVRQFAGSRQRGKSIGNRRISQAAICRAVTITSRFVPGASCLPQAMAAQALLSRAGMAAELCIGVRRNGLGIYAHAWLEDSSGHVLIGHADMTQLVRMER